MHDFDFKAENFKSLLLSTCLRSISSWFDYPLLGAIRRRRALAFAGPDGDEAGGPWWWFRLLKFGVGF